MSTTPCKYTYSWPLSSKPEISLTLSPRAKARQRQVRYSGCAHHLLLLWWRLVSSYLQAHLDLFVRRLDVDMLVHIDCIGGSRLTFPNRCFVFLKMFVVVSTARSSSFVCCLFVFFVLHSGRAYLIGIVALIMVFHRRPVVQHSAIKDLGFIAVSRWNWISCVGRRFRHPRGHVASYVHRFLNVKLSHSSLIIFLVVFLVVGRNTCSRTAATGLQQQQRNVQRLRMHLPQIRVVLRALKLKQTATETTRLQ